MFNSKESLLKKIKLEQLKKINWSDMIVSIFGIIILYYIAQFITRRVKEIKMKMKQIFGCLPMILKKKKKTPYLIKKVMRF